MHAHAGAGGDAAEDDEPGAQGVRVTRRAARACRLPQDFSLLDSDSGLLLLGSDCFEWDNGLQHGIATMTLRDQYLCSPASAYVAALQDRLPHMSAAHMLNTCSARAHADTVAWALGSSSTTQHRHTPCFASFVHCDDVASG